MTRLCLFALIALLAGCDQGPPPTITTPPDPDDASATSTERAYRPVMAGTVDHGLGDRP